jgi:hypothetical protein
MSASSSRYLKTTSYIGLAIIMGNYFISSKVDYLHIIWEDKKPIFPIYFPIRNLK